jgi:phosphoglycolate phosphatase
VLKQEKMSGFFRDVLGADRMTSKTEKINHAMKVWGKETGETFYIGDTAGDVREARNAGVRSVAVTWGWHSEERLRTAGPDYIVRSPRDLVALDGRPADV